MSIGSVEWVKIGGFLLENPHAYREMVVLVPDSTVPGESYTNCANVVQYLHLVLDQLLQGELG